MWSFYILHTLNMSNAQLLPLTWDTRCRAAWWSCKMETYEQEKFNLKQYTVGETKIILPGGL